MLALAGMYEWWRPQKVAGNEHVPWLLTATIITRDSQAQMASIHPRQPLYLTPDLWDTWLNTSPADRTLVNTVLNATAAIAENLDYRPIGPAWLSTQPNTRQDNPDLVAAI